MSEADDMIGEHLLGFADKMFNSNGGVIFTKNYGLLPNDIFYSMALNPRNYKVEYVLERIPNFSLAGWWVTSYAVACADSPIIWAPMAVSALYDLVKSFQMQHLAGLFTDSGSSVFGDRNGGVIFGSDYNDFLPSVMTKSLASDTLLYAAHSTLLGVLRKAEHAFYLDPAVQSTNCYVQDITQMCYSNSNHIIYSIIDMGAGVITIENSRSDGMLLSVFRVGVKYGAGIGPGVYDIHSPKIPSTGEIADRINKMLSLLDTNILWVNPDSGLKTCKYTEVKPTLQNMVAAAKLLRTQLASTK